ncbi:hypothetical protein AMD27_13225 [Acinetobacter sp. TGL-Y2]|uniref:hypothetical protein n=1 Tax=Acinetobacter sp. TGL-Y2 TaxID=1407071 RepID=UPI0007A671B0|nr:hypothetical protein [Acinetobacter sp. TGL-Y2]AMW79763.1 hypothetical protein AMD27_13225 [Acinetobacter sp. TGL-Y2]
MREKLQEWMEFHSAVMSRFPGPGYLMILSCLIVMGVSWLYPKIIYAIANFQIMGTTPYQNFIIKHSNYVGLGMWIVPIGILVVLMFISWKIHQKNVEKYYK